MNWAICGNSAAFTWGGAAGLFSLGLVGSLHCAGMCGPLSCLFTKGRGEQGGLWAYHAARLAAYAGLGILFWRLGAPLRLGANGRLLPWLLVLSLFGYALLGGLRSPGFLARWHGAGYRRIAAWPGALRGAGLGLLTPLLPCGLLYTAAGLSLAASGPAIAALWMLCFAAGTLPLLALSQWGLRAGERFSRHGAAWRRGAAALAALSLLAAAWRGGL